MPSCFRPAGFDPVADALKFYIAPRYTTGSVGRVRDAVAQQLVRAERAGYEETISLSTNRGYDAACTLGLSGIVEERWEFRGRTHFRDLMTGEYGVYNADGGKLVAGRIK